MNSDPLTVLIGDAVEQLRTLPDASINACITSPPYWGMRDYGVAEQLGHEGTPSEYVERLVGVFREVRRVLRDDGTLWINLGDCYTGKAGGEQGKTGVRASRSFTGSMPGVTRLGDGLKPKDLVGIPWRVAFALQSHGWYLRQDIIWHKPNPMPESVQDRCTRSHEYIFLLSKSPRYYFDSKSIREPAITTSSGNLERRLAISGDRQRLETHLRSSVPWADDGTGRNRRDVWSVQTHPYNGAHFATFPEALVEPMLLAGVPVGGTVLDPFAGSGTVGAVALRRGRRALLIDLNPDFLPLINDRCRVTGQLPGLAEAAS